MHGSWNNFEGCCWVRDGETEIWYALWPALRECTPLAILQAFGASRQNWWVVELQEVEPNKWLWVPIIECDQQPWPWE